MRERDTSWRKGPGELMTSRDQYRQYAADCVRVAQQVNDPADKATLLQMAKMWLGLADLVEKGILEKNDNENQTA
jgi:hypothetical protein